MKEDKDKIYFADDALAGEEFASIDKNQLVIVFNKYEVAPGSMGVRSLLSNTLI